MVGPHRFGAMLREYRLRATLTQEELADKSGVSVRTISLLETGKRTAPRLASARLLARGLALPAFDGEALLAAARGSLDCGPDSPAAAARPTIPDHSRLATKWYLPNEVPDFVARDIELDRLLATARGTARRSVVITTVSGMAGIGKTTLAVHAAHAMAANYPDGRFACDLRGFTPGHASLDPALALEQLLRADGVAAHDIPASLDGRAAVWRTAVAGRRVLLLLDNAADADQVRPLLPGTPGSLTVVTSRRRLPALDGATPISLDVLPPADAILMFTRIAGHDRAVDRHTAAEIVQLCGYLPLAIRIAAVRLAHRPTWTAADLVARLRVDEHRLAELNGSGMPHIATAFEQSYRRLDPVERRLFRILAARSDSAFEPCSAAALTGISPRQAENVLESLVDHHLLLQPSHGRYVFHDLLREYARTLEATHSGDDPTNLTRPHNVHSLGPGRVEWLRGAALLGEPSEHLGLPSFDGQVSATNRA